MQQPEAPAETRHYLIRPVLSMEPLWLQPELFALFGAVVLPAEAADIEGREACGTQENLSWDILPSHNITLTMGNSRISETSLSNGPVFTELQKPETLNQINNSWK